MRRSRVLSVLALVPLVLAACEQEDPTLIGEAQATLQQVPADVQCVRITAAGATRTVERSFSVASQRQ